jgi:hypothetical protein
MIWYSKPNVKGGGISFNQTNRECGSVLVVRMTRCFGASTIDPLFFKPASFRWLVEFVIALRHFGMGFPPQDMGLALGFVMRWFQRFGLEATSAIRGVQ